MKRTFATLLLGFGVLGSAPAFAQEAPSPAGRVEVTLIPAGGTFFVKGSNTGEPSFGNYNLGGSVTFNVNRYIGIEGEVGGSLGVSQSLQFPAFQRNVSSPNLVQYSGNLVVSAPTRRSVVPYITGGVGGMNVFDETTLGIQGTTKAFLTGNVGGGLKWFAGRWGLRGDYRFIAARARDDAPDFFGKETRYGHRLYGGIILNVGR
jgi:hypothetical protein